MTRTLEAKLLLTGSDKTGKATGSAARGLENVAKTAKRAEDAWKRASAAQRAMATNVRTNSREVERLQRSMQVQADKHVQQIRRINGAVSRLRAGANAVDAAILGASRYIAPIAAVTAATKALNDYASAADALERIGITGDADDKTMTAVGKEVRSIAQDVALPIGTVTGGLDTLVSAGKSVEEAMAMLPAVAAAAQASNSDIRDIAASAVAVGESFDIAADKMERAFDVMAHGGKLGKFELKDMAQYLPSLAPLAATQGYTGEEGLKRVVAMLQVVRSQTGRAENAAVGLNDLLSKMETDETANKFEDFGVDIRAWMDNARKQGQDTVLAFLDAINKAIGEDYTKLPQLLGDKESRMAALALLTNRPQLEEYVTGLGAAEGTVGRDLLRLTDNLEQGFQRVKNAVDMVGESAGKMISSFGVPDGLLQIDAMLVAIAGKLDVIAGREGGLIEKLTGRKDGYLEKLAQPVGADGLVNQSLFGWINEQTGGALDWIVDDSERVTPPVGDGSPGALYEHPIQQAAADAAGATADFLLGQRRVPLPAPAPGRPPAAGQFQMKPEDMSRPILVGGYAAPPKRPAHDAAVLPMPWDAYTLPPVRPAPAAIAPPIPAAALEPPITPAGVPFQMRAEDIAAPTLAAAGPLPQAVQGLVIGVAGAADAVDRFAGTLDSRAPGPHLNEMDDDALLSALGGQAAVDGIAGAADEAAGKLEQLPAAMKPEAFAAAGRSSMVAFEGEVDAGIARIEAKLQAASSRFGSAASFTASPRIAPQIVPPRGSPPPVDADRGASMPNISERLP